MAGRPWMLSETSWSAVRDTEYALAVLPWGATEPHNLHLPYGTDTVETEAIAAEAAGRAWERGARVVVLPTIPIGANAQQLGLRLTLHLAPDTQLRILEDVVDALERHGVPRLVILNGHGGNDFKAMVRQVQLDAELFVCVADWYRAADPEAHFGEPGDHAGEMETSLMLHLAPELCRPLEEAGDGAARSFRISAFREGWAWAPRDWPRVTDDTGVGDPSAATAEKGRAYFDAVSGALADFLVELAETDPDDLYA